MHALASKLVPASLLAFVAVPLAGCLARPYQGQAMYALDGGPLPAAVAAEPPTHDVVLRISDVSVATPFDSSQFMYRYADGSMRSDPYAGYVASPDALIERALIAHLGADRLFSSVVGMDLPGVQAYELVVSIGTLVTVYEGNEGTARVAGTAFVMDPIGTLPALVATMQASADARVEGDGSTAVAAAMNGALAKWIDAIGEQMRAATLPPLRDAASRAGALSGIRSAPPASAAAPPIAATE